MKRYKCILFAAALAAALGLLLAGCGAPAETPEPSGGGESGGGSYEEPSGGGESGGSADIVDPEA